MFRKSFTFRSDQRKKRGDDHDTSDGEGDSKSILISPLAPERRRSSASSSITDRSTRDPLGLKVVHRPPQDRKVDIVFVHGLGGSSRMTWSKDHDLDNFWPLHYLPLEPEIGDARIMTFGYNANFKPGSGSNSMSVLDFAKELLYDLKYAMDESVPELEDLRLGEKPIIFLVHSMGGLIVKEAYMQGKDDPKYASIIKAISSIIFLSTPHRGTNLAETLNRILRVSLTTGPMQFISELASGSQTLQKLNESFRHVAEKLQIISFYETRPTTMLKSTTKIMVLEKESSVLGYPGEISKPLDADHHGVCKYSGPDDPRYITVRNVLKKLVAKAKPGKSPYHHHANSGGSSSSSSLSLTSHGHKQRRTSSKEVAAAQAALTQNARANLDDYLSSAESPNQDFNFFRDRWAPGTCEWILDNEVFTSWLQDQGRSPRLLWFQGNAASGKSVMSSFIIDKLVRDGLPCHYFFLRFSDQKKRSLGTLLRSLAAQMAKSIPEYARSLLEVAHATTDLKAADFRSIWQWFFKDTLLVNGKCLLESPIYWIIDGLDEASTPASLIRLLADLGSTSVPLRVLIVSRKTHEISSAFVRLGKRVHMETVWVEGCQQDLLAYVDQEMDFSEEGEYRDKVTSQLLDRAGGNFLWLHLAVHKINQCHTKFDVERALDGLPSGMQELYDRMALSVQNQPTASDRRLGQSILGWATCAQRTLTVEELREALRGKSGLREIVEIHRTIEDLCGGFVVVDNEDKIAMIHETAREYLTSHTSPDDPERPRIVDRRLTHDVLFQRCIACLSEPMLRSLINRGQPPALLDYATSSWFIHLSMGTCTDPNTEILDIVVRFLRSPSVLVWILSAARQNALRFLVIASRYLAGVVLALRRIQDEDESLAQRQATEVIEGWATDLIKVVGKFGKNLTQDPDSIYRLIPPFCPSPSMVYQQFGSKESRVLQVSGTATAKWDDCLARFSFDPGAMASSVLDAGSRLVILTIVRRTSTIITYSDSTFEELRRMEHPERVLMIQANKLGTLLMSYGYKTTRIWNLATGECIKVVDNPTGRLRPQTAMFVNDQVLVGNEDRRIRSVLISASEDLDPCSGWEVKSHVEEQAQVWEGTIANAPTCSAISHDGRMVAYGYRQHPVTVWELEPTMFRNQIDVGADTDLMEVSSLKWHPLRPEIFCLSSVGFLYRWDPVFDQASNMTSSGADTFCLNRNGSLVATGDAVGTIKVYASADLSLLCQLSSQDTILNLSFSSDSRRLYDMRSMYGIVWEPNTLVRLAEKSEYPESNTDILGDSESLAKLSLHSEHTAARFGGVVSLARQPVGSLYCYGTEDGVALLGEVAKPDVGELTRSASYLSVEHVVWSEDGRLVVLSDLGGRLLIKRVTRSPDGWNVHHEHDLQIPTSQGHITQLAFHPSGDRLLVTTSSTLHCVDLRSWEVTNAPCPAALERQVKWTCHPTMPEYFLGFSSTEVRINSWANLCEVGAQVYLPPRTTTQDPVDSPPDAGSIPSRDRTFRRDCGRLGRLISGQQLPDILLETLHTAASGELKREFLIFEAADICISSTGDNDKASLRYTTLPDHVRSRIREPLTFLPRRRLAYLDVDRWICTYRLSTPPALSITRRSESSIPSISGGGTSSRDSEAASQRRLSLQRPAEGFGRGVVTRHGSDSASGNNNGIEKYYFLPGDWVMANEAHLCTMMSDGTLLCPQNGGIASVQSATLRR